MAAWFEESGKLMETISDWLTGEIPGVCSGPLSGWTNNWLLHEVTADARAEQCLWINCFSSWFGDLLSDI